MWIKYVFCSDECRIYTLARVATDIGYIFGVVEKFVTNDGRAKTISISKSGIKYDMSLYSFDEIWN